MSSSATRQRRRGLVLAGALALVASVARAGDTDTPPFEVAYEAPAECPSAESFRQGVLDRARVFDRAPFVAARVVVVRIEDLVSGVLALVRRDGSTVERRLDAGVCDEVVDGLALMAAIAIEDEREEERSPQRLAHPRPAPPPRPSSEIRASAGLQIGATDGVTSEPIASIQSYFELTRRTDAGLEPSLRATLKFGLPVHVEPDAAGARTPMARVQWSAGALSVCPAGLMLAQWAELRPCAEGNLGFAKIAGPEGGGPRLATKLWAHVAALARLTAELPVGRHSPHRSAVVELELGGLLPLTRYEVTFGGDSVYIVPRAGFSAGAGVGYSF
jgi:hypothetical protein